MSRRDGDGDPPELIERFALLQRDGDHELRNWIVAAGIMGERKLEVTCCLESWVSTGFRVFGIWR